MWSAMSLDIKLLILLICWLSKESHIILQGGMVRGSSLGFMIVSLTILMFLVFSAFTASGGELTPKKVFTTLSLLIVLRLTTVHFFVQNVLAVSEGRVAVVRLQVGFTTVSCHSCRTLVGDVMSIYFVSVLHNNRSCLRWRNWWRWMHQSTVVTRQYDSWCIRTFLKLLFWYRRPCWFKVCCGERHVGILEQWQGEGGCQRCLLSSDSGS